MIWLHYMCGQKGARALHSKLYCAVFQKYEDRIHGMKQFLCAGITGSGNQKTSNVINHAILSYCKFYQ